MRKDWRQGKLKGYILRWKHLLYRATGEEKQYISKPGKVTANKIRLQDFSSMSWGLRCEGVGLSTDNNISVQHATTVPLPSSLSQIAFPVLHSSGDATQNIHTVVLPSVTDNIIFSELKPQRVKYCEALAGQIKNSLTQRSRSLSSKKVLFKEMPT